MGGSVRMQLEQTDVEFVSVCECGTRFNGDSMLDAVTRWAFHVADTAEHRESL